MLTVLKTLLTVAAGVGIAVALYFVLNFVAERLPSKWEGRVKPYFYVLPALAVVVIYILYPTVVTIIYSFANADSTKFIGLKNFTDLLVKNVNDFHSTLFNTLLWITVVPFATIALGLVVATLADRLGPRSEKLSKSLIFAPMAIGGVGAATIWRFVFAADPKVGLQNAVWHTVGASPVAWLQDQKFHLNSFELMIIVLWGTIGFSMVLLSAAIKGVPVDTIEAARIDGANELQIFFRVIFPQIRVTVVTVFITVLITTLKVFDVIYATTDGNFNTSVIGLEFFNQQNTALNSGYAAAIVVILLVAVAPVMFYQVRQFRAQEANR